MANGITGREVNHWLAGNGLEIIENDLH